MDLYKNHINLPDEPGNGRASISELVQTPTFSLDNNCEDVLTSQSSFLSEYK